MAGTSRGMVAANIWAGRIIPAVLLGMIIYASYIIYGPLSANYLISRRKQKGAAIAILVTYSFLLLLLFTTFLRLLHITYTQPCYVPLGPAAVRDLERKRTEKRHMKNAEKRDGIGGAEYTGADGDADTPGMEMFYTKDIFVSEMDGKPKWCTHCANWKPDRAHHCSSSGRCIERMDHFCPWVGGPVGENNFKFFIQFTGYAALYCLHIGIVMAFYVHQQRTDPNERLDPHFAVALGLASFFGLFTAGMTATSAELAIRNQTQVERLGAETRIHILAFLKPPGFRVPSAQEQTSPILAYPELTYPLEFESAAQSAHADLSVMNDNLATQTHSGAPQGRQSPLRDFSTGSTVVSANGSRPSSEANKEGFQSLWPTPAIAARDRQATRTFLILKMLEPGYNPWDLGSSRLNWESVMGYSVLDWLLPLKRSPCCNHEEGESYYQVGPMVDLLKARYGLIQESEIRAYGGKLRDERLDPRDYPSAVRAEYEQQQQARREEDDGGEKKRRRRRKDKDDTTKENISSGQPDIEMGEMNERV